MVDENLKPGVNMNEYCYYVHSKYPLHIVYDISDGKIKVKVTKYFKNHEIKTLEKESRIINKMTTEQIENYILDVVDIFLKR